MTKPSWISQYVKVWTAPHAEDVFDAAKDKDSKRTGDNDQDSHAADQVNGAPQRLEAILRAIAGATVKESKLDEAFPPKKGAKSSSNGGGAGGDDSDQDQYSSNGDEPEENDQEDDVPNDSTLSGKDVKLQLEKIALQAAELYTQVDDDEVIDDEFEDQLADALGIINQLSSSLGGDDEVPDEDSAQDPSNNSAQKGDQTGSNPKASGNGSQDPDAEADAQTDDTDDKDPKNKDPKKKKKKKEKDLSSFEEQLSEAVADYKKKHVQGLYHYTHFQHPNGSFVQIRNSKNFEAMHQDTKGERKIFKDFGELKTHLSKLKEEIEITEVSKGLLSRYVQKAARSMSHDAYRAGELDGKTDFSKAADPHIKKAEKRVAGIQKAASKLGEDRSFSKLVLENRKKGNE